uniref:Ig-like domain-containing protein n=1 Tax=Capra hircus TaxID=9925 RepID=A0A8C2NQH7_CAPHI
MRFPAQLRGLLLLWVPGSIGAMMQTQTLRSLSVIHGEKASISCRASQSIQNRYGYNFLHWYKPSQNPQLLIYRASNWESGVPDRFTSSGLGADTILIVSRVEAEDARVYYCQQSLQAPPTVIQPQTETSLSWWPSCSHVFMEGMRL